MKLHLESNFHIHLRENPKSHNLGNVDVALSVVVISVFF
jgi:hypothetical protein